MLNRMYKRNNKLQSSQVWLFVRCHRFQPARRVLIPKEWTSGMRKLGIPVVMDRIVGTSMHSVLEEVFDPAFTASSFGFRRGRSQHQAIRHLQGLVKEGREWAVAIDLKSFFDEIPRDLILLTDLSQSGG
ncbi:reverse transcriptase domain-containing protein [Crocinitomicaceae bacterium]|nr:reverse transcriptase domain-containing protein [Crocinitomicaceae bacterium]